MSYHKKKKEKKEEQTTENIMLIKYCSLLSTKSIPNCNALLKCVNWLPVPLQEEMVHLTLTVLDATIDAQWEGMGDVGSARYEPALLPPCPTTSVLSYSN